MESPRGSAVVQRVARWVLIAIVATLIGYAAWMATVQFTKRSVTVMIGRATLSAEVADNDDTRRRGLAGREKIADHAAMLFVFDRDDSWKIWMKDMKMPIDVVWLDAKKTVVHVEHNVQPDAEPYREYQPPKPARYVLETAAGVAKDKGIREGVQASFEVEGRS
ncbi:MAG: DUF192 domain-containing protein [Candidatus Saccharibacteria bacterium]|nr:DUF192 domain-containing protein [Candidatus Saccharibacteria bacterium]